MWRFPVLLPGDMQLWEAKPLPHGVNLLERNGIFVSQMGAGILDLGGGDLDGDFLVVCQDIWPDLGL